MFPVRCWWCGQPALDARSRWAERALNRDAAPTDDVPILCAPCNAKLLAGERPHGLDRWCGLPMALPMALPMG